MVIMLLWWLLGAADPRLLGENGIPLVCRPVEAAAVDNDAALARQLARASCTAHERMNALAHLRNTDVSGLALGIAVAPAFAMLDDAERSATPAWRIVAEQMRGDLYVTMAVRLRTAPGESTPAESAHRVADWLMRARIAYEQIRTISIMHPEVFRDSRASRAMAETSPSLLR